VLVDVNVQAVLPVKSKPGFKGLTSPVFCTTASERVYITARAASVELKDPTKVVVVMTVKDKEEFEAPACRYFSENLHARRLQNGVVVRTFKYGLALPLRSTR